MLNKGTADRLPPDGHHVLRTERHLWQKMLLAFLTGFLFELLH